MALASIRKLKPDVAVVDVEMPGLSGIDIARTVTDQDLPTSILLLSVHRDEAFVHAALEAGVEGYVLKDDAPDELIQAIHAIARSEIYLSRSIQTARQSGIIRPRELSPRQRDIVRLLARGLTSKEIARELGLSAKTVEGYRAVIMEKLHLRSVAHLVKYAIRHGISTVDD
jgi:DNA-binding NarL/FixJ family response regulator